jgi:hypothetical protein
MSEPQEKASDTYDPFEPFRSMRDTCLDAMAKAMVEAVNTDAYAQATGSMLESCLTAAVPFRDALEKSMAQALQQLSLPSRQDVSSLAERFSNVEMRLDDMDAKLDAIRNVLGQRNGSTPQSSGGGEKHVTASAATEDKAGATRAAGERRETRRPFVRGKVRRPQR